MFPNFVSILIIAVKMIVMEKVFVWKISNVIVIMGLVNQPVLKLRSVKKTVMEMKKMF